MRMGRRLVVDAVRIYQVLISPILVIAFGPACRFQPTCSDYMRQAIERRGVIVGVCLGIRRLLRCHPLGGHGYDPVPEPPAQPIFF